MPLPTTLFAFLFAGGISCLSCSSGTYSIAGATSCVTLVAFVPPPVAAFIGLLVSIYCMLKRRVASPFLPPFSSPESHSLSPILSVSVSVLDIVSVCICILMSVRLLARQSGLAFTLKPVLLSIFYFLCP